MLLLSPFQYPSSRPTRHRYSPKALFLCDLRPRTLCPCRTRTNWQTGDYCCWQKAIVFATKHCRSATPPRCPARRAGQVVVGNLGANGRCRDRRHAGPGNGCSSQNAVNQCRNCPVPEMIRPNSALPFSNDNVDRRGTSLREVVTS